MLKRSIAFFALVASFHITVIVKAQTIRGVVTSINGDKVAEATIRLKNANVSTTINSLGKYELSTTFRGKTWLICTADDYKTDSALIEVKEEGVVRNFRLKKSGIDLAVVKIRAAPKKLSSDIKTISVLNDLEIATTPGAVADVAAALQTLPGAAPAGNETGLFVHGGSADETKTFLDGMLVKNFFGSKLPDVANRSRFSPFLFKETTFSTSSYSSGFGQALSSSLVLETKDLPRKTSTEFALTGLGGGGAHTQRFKNSALIVSADYYNFDFNNAVFKQNIDWHINPRKYQTMVNYKLKTSKTGMFKVFAEYSGTNLAFNIVNPNTQNTDLFTNFNKNTYLNLNYQSFIRPKLKMYAGVAYNNTSEDGKVNQDKYYQYDNVWQEKVMFTTYMGSNVALSAGVEQFQSKRDEGFSTLSRAYNDVLSAGFVNAEIAFLHHFMFKGGIRAERSSYMDKSNIAPRTVLLWYPNKINQFSLSYGKFYAKPDDSFLAQTAVIGYELANQYALGYEYAKKSRNLRVEVYYKDYDHLVKIETPIYSGFQAYGPPIQINQFNNNGYGYARGVDILWRDKKTLKFGDYYASYSFLDTKRNYIDYPDEARPSFAPMHTFNLVARKFTKYKTQLSAAYTFSSGRTYFNPNNPNFLSDKTKNSHNFSVGATYLPSWWKQFVVISFHANNILGFKNVYGYRYSYDGKNRETILPPYKRGYLLSFLINIGDAGFNH